MKKALLLLSVFFALAVSAVSASANTGPPGQDQVVVRLDNIHAAAPALIFSEKSVTSYAAVAMNWSATHGNGHSKPIGAGSIFAQITVSNVGQSQGGGQRLALDIAAGSAAKPCS